MTKPKMKYKYTITFALIGLLIIATFSVVLFYNNEKTSYQTFIEVCEDTNGQINNPVDIDNTNKYKYDYSVCSCYYTSGIFAYPVYYKDIKTTVWDGC